MARVFTLDEARGLVRGVPSPVGEAKGLEARLSELLSWFPEQGLDVKGVAPLLVDFPARLNGETVLLCWLEGEHELGWYHKPEHGFAGRRVIPVPGPPPGAPEAPPGTPPGTPPGPPAGGSPDRPKTRP